MQTINIEIVEPIALDFLQKLANKKIINLNTKELEIYKRKSAYNSLLNSLKEDNSDISFEEIMNEIEEVRKENYKA